jgi:hypothetical protein
MKDKYSAVWVSHSSISDYLKCPRAYFLKNMYKNPLTNRKITLMSPPLALGQAVHELVESLSQLPVDDRLALLTPQTFAPIWAKVSGLKGGFSNPQEEEAVKTRALSMLDRIKNHPGPIIQKAVKLREKLPYYWLSEEDNLILCGKIDWLEYDANTDSVSIIDFKTGKYDEDPNSLQLPIYLLLANHSQNRPIAKAYYWYLDRDDAPCQIPLPDLDSAYKNLLAIGKKIALARKLGHFTCPQINGCRACLPLEMIVKGQAKLVGLNDYGTEIYVSP